MTKAGFLVFRAALTRRRYAYEMLPSQVMERLFCASQPISLLFFQVSTFHVHVFSTLLVLFQCLLGAESMQNNNGTHATLIRFDHK